MFLNQLFQIELQKMSAPNRINVKAEQPFELSSQGLNFRSNGLQVSNNTSQPIRGDDKSKTSKPNGFSKANWELALKRVKQKKNQYYKGKQVGMFVDLDHFKIFGTGIYLFFSFMKGLVVIFLLLSIVFCLPCLANYMLGNGLANVPTSINYYFAKTSIANYDSSTDTNSTYHKLLNTLPSMVGISIFIVYYFIWLYRSNTLATQVRKQVKLRSYNVVELINPPAEARQQDIMKYMSQFGTVTEIAAVNNYSQTIDISKNIYEKQIEIKELEMKAENQSTTQYAEEIKQKKMDVQDIYKELVLYQDEIKEEVIKYFITFSKMEEREKALKELQPHLKSSCDCFRDSSPQKYLLLGQRVNVVACHTEPGQIIWQNQHVTWKSRWLRSIIQFVLLLALISFGFFFIQFMNLLTPSTTTLAVNTYSYNQTSILSEANATIISAWCLANTQSAIQTSGSSLYNLCYPYIKDYYLKILITVGIAIGVVIMKELLKIIVIMIAKFQRYTTHTEQSKDIIQNLFLTYTTTTVLITLLLQAKFQNISFKNVVSSLINLDTLSQNSASLKQYEDFMPYWYLDIGYQICINWVVMIIHPFFTLSPVLFILEKWKYYRASSEQIQAKMQARIQPAEFELEDHYANVLMIAVVSLTFAAGMPIIIILGFLALLSRYLYSKYIFIRHSKVPKTYDQSLDTKMSRILPYGILLFFAFGIWMFGASSIFKRDSSFAEKWTNTLSYPFLKQITFILQRFFGTWYFSALFGVVAIIFAFKIFLYNLIISRCIDDTKQTVQIQLEPNVLGQQSVNEEITPISSKNLCDSYKIQNNPDYREILQIRQAKKKYVVRTIVKGK